MCHSLGEQGESPQVVQELGAAALVEVHGGRRVGRLLQSEDDDAPAFLPHCDGAEVPDAEGERPPALLMAVVQRA